ncbi:SGNH/GDSL hydrolase family protein [Actinoplanes solisilvae]|uniref:SGNH/GDSL hydrolase family protein n=1 Tax=Actinoplanes solisilvae TaxID=2486853 RepID=UPI0013E36BD7|nr:SGNH/GDSL hydrolase family protein [Actinoplanes solisilvae]
MKRFRKSAVTVSAALVVFIVVAIVLVRRDSTRNDDSGGTTGVAQPSAEPSPDPTTGASTEPSTEPSAAGTPWTGTWAVALQDGGRGFERQTVRQVVRTSIGGDTVRLRLSNEFGTGPLTVSAVYLARSLRTSTVDAGTNTKVTFGGTDSVTIAAGKTAVSDAVDFTLPAGADVAVTAYVPQEIDSVSQHVFANRNNYAASGNQSAKASLSGARTFDNYAFLAGVDVQNAAALGSVVALGASITDGFDSSFNQSRRWPDQLAKRLLAAGTQVGVLNAGISGNMLVGDGSGESAVKRFDRDVLAQPGVKWVIVSDTAINDLGGDDGIGSTELVAAMQDLIQRSHDAGVKIFCSTLTPYEGADYWSSQGETGRAAINDFLKADGSGCDAVVDFDAALHNPSSPTKYAARYDTGDHLHPNDAGMEALAAAVDLDLFRS